MQFAYTVLFKCPVVLSRPVSLVPFKSVLGKLRSKMLHPPVAPNFSDNRGERDERLFLIAANNRLLKQI